MLPRAGLSSIRPVAAIDAPTLVATLADARQDAVSRLAQIALGQQVQAKVLSTLDDGTFLVRINDATARMNLPLDAKVGDTLRLTLASTTPRPTFLLGQEAAGAAATTSVSPTGRLIDGLLQAQAARQSSAPPTLQASTPLLNAATPQPTQIATALRDAVVFSGLFYESHVSQWAAGNRTLPELMREPQTQTQAAKILAANPESQAQATKILATNPEAMPHTQSLNQATTQLVAQQLDTLENQRVLWRGELWPGQPLEWEISRDAPDGGRDSAPPAEPTWQSVVRFELPLLGAVSATIKLAGQHVQMQLRTDSDAATAALRANGSRLADALGAAGSSLDALTVKRREPAP